MKRFLAAASIAAIAAGCGGAQTLGVSTSSTGTGTSSTAPATIPPRVSTPSGTSGSNMPGAGNGGLYLTGRVVVDDGSPIPTNITIQRVCSGSARSVAYVNSTGTFSFRTGQTDGTVMADASEPGSGGRNGASSGATGSARLSGSSNPFSIGQSSGAALMGCELRAEVPGYRSGSVVIGNRTSMDGPDVGSIVLHRTGPGEGSSVSATSYMAPKDAQKAYERGLLALSKEKPEEAAREFEKAVAKYPKYAVAWVSLGKLRAQEQDFGPAREAFLKALEADPKLVSPGVELGFLAAEQKNWEEAGQYLDKALKLDPIDFPNAWYADAIANFNLKKFDAAERSAREAVKVDVKHTNPRAQYLLAIALIEKHDYPEASGLLKSYLKADPNAADYATVKDQSDRLEKFLEQSKPEANAAQQR